MIRSTGGRLIANYRRYDDPGRARWPEEPVRMAHRSTFIERHQLAVIVAVGIAAGVLLGLVTAGYGLGVR